MSYDMIAESAERLFSARVTKEVREAASQGAFPDDLWQAAAESGFPLALCSENSGGIAASWSDVFSIFRGLGYWQVPLPLAETMIGGFLLSIAGIAVPAEPVTVVEAGPELEFEQEPGKSAGSLSGTVLSVPWGRHCRWALLSFSGIAPRTVRGSLVLVDLNQPDVLIGHHTNYAAEPLDTIEFRDAFVGTVFSNPLSGVTRPIFTLGALAYSAMISGAIESALEQTLQYARDRVQFGRPLSRFQVIQQSLAHLAGEAASVRMAVVTAFSEAPNTTQRACPTLLFDTAVAKLLASEVASIACSVAHQVHGAMGFTQEHPLHLATKRLWSWRERFGSDAQWADVLGKLAIGNGGKAFWTSLTSRFSHPTPGT